MNSPVKVSNVSLSLPLPDHKHLRLIQTLLKLGADRVKPRDFADPENINMIQVLKNIDFELSAGDSLALIGTNGAGKSTLLKLIAGVYKPTVGSLEVTGKVGSVLDNNVFLIPEASGYENFKIAFGFSGSDASDFASSNEWVQNFANIGDFYFLPVRCYSNGMLARLGFAFSLLSTPDILLIDEHLGAGDEKFQERVKSELDNYIGNVKATIVASHSRNLLRRFCNKGCVMDKGKILFMGPLEDALKFFSQHNG